MKYFTRILIVIILISMCIISVNVQAIEQEMVDSGISYIEDTKTLENPDRGFYSTMPILCTPTDTKIKDPKGSLIHLRIGIGAFSKAQNQVADMDFTEHMLEALNSTLENIRQNGGTAIIRFAYDNFNGIANQEPKIEQIIRHIEQLKPLFEKNEDVITCVESGFFGPYGEQHTSKIITKENFEKMLNALLEAVPKTRTISVRTPKIYANYVGIPVEELKNYQAEEGTKAYRIGIFNDGYLGSETDLGTYHNREEAISWLQKQAMHTVYGGEVVANYATSDYVYNSPEHIEKEMYLTHTTYLNKEWNDSVIRNWKQVNYQGKDSIYQGQTAFQYIENHLGYRFVLRESKVTKQIEQDKFLKLQCKIENVGAGNIVNQKEAILILVGENTYYQKLQLDPRKWNSKQTTQITIDHFIDSEVSTGDYKIYLKIANSGQEIEDTKRTIEFANPSIWEEALGANFLGKVTVIKKTEEAQKNEIVNNTTNNETNGIVNNITNEIVNNTINNASNETNNQIKNEMNGQTYSREDNTIAKKELPQTGENSLFGIKSLLFVLILIAIYLYKKGRYN